MFTHTHTHTHTVPPPTITFSGQLVSPVDLCSTLYAGTVFTLTCEVSLVQEVDTSVTISTSWSKDGANLSGSDRISVDGMASQSGNTTYMYGSDLVFTPLSNQHSVGDDGNYMCTATVQDSTYITGSDNSGTEMIAVEGQ